MIAIDGKYNNCRRTGMTDPEGRTGFCSWTDDDQLAAVALPSGGGIVTNTYNGDGMRFSRTDANGTNSFAWNGKVLDAQLGAGNTVSTWYTQGMGEYGDIISARDAVAGASSLQLYDASGNVNQTTDAGANITATLSYDAFGNVTDNSGPANPTVAWQGKQGYQFEQPLGLQYVRQRWYDPATRQFISQDPLGFGGGDVNLFRYAGNNPVNRNDPSGQDMIDDLTLPKVSLAARPLVPPATAPASQLSHPETKQYWQVVALHDAGIDPAQWHPRQGYDANRHIIHLVYRYYKELYLHNQKALLWAGMARLAGAAAVGGMILAKSLQDSSLAKERHYISHARKEFAIIQSDPAYDPGRYLAIGIYLADLAEAAAAARMAVAAGKLKIDLIKMNKAIFEDLAWQHAAYEHGGLKEMEKLASVHLLTLHELRAWKQIASGVRQNVEKGNLYLLYREQHHVLQKGGYYRDIRNLFPLTGQAMGAMMMVTGSPVPGGESFEQVDPFGDITRFNQRWKWIQIGVVQPFEHTSLQQRQAWVREPFWSRVEEFSP